MTLIFNKGSVFLGGLQSATCVQLTSYCINNKTKKREKINLLLLWACGIRELSRECGQCVWVTCGRLVRP